MNHARLFCYTIRQTNVVYLTVQVIFASLHFYDTLNKQHRKQSQLLHRANILRRNYSDVFSDSGKMSEQYSKQSSSKWPSYGSVEYRYSNEDGDSSENTENTEQIVKPTWKCLGIEKRAWFLTIYVLFYFVFLLTGGLVFSALEAPLENQVRQNLIRTRSKFLQSYPNVNGKLIICNQFIS